MFVVLSFQARMHYIELRLHCSACFVRLVIALSACNVRDGLIEMKVADI